MLGNLKRCIGCMNEIGNLDHCPYCGYSASTVTLPEHIPPKNIINDKYVIGAAIKDSCQTITYIAFDNFINQVVEIKEYFPFKLCNRQQDSLYVTPADSFETQYKAYLLDFIELYSDIHKLRTLGHIMHVYDIFEMNNTAYAVCEHVKGISLKQYILQNGGEIALHNTVSLIRPIINTLSVLNSKNLIHRGISPDTLILTNKNQLKIIDFAISSTRVVNSDLDYELFSGYSAPEQYTTNSYHGPWTDVYAIAAIIYKMLTSTMPSDAKSRLSNDNIIAPHKLNPSIPYPISSIILSALELNHSIRIRNMNELSSKLNSCLPDFNPVPKNSNPNNLNSVNTKPHKSKKNSKKKLSSKKIKKSKIKDNKDIFSDNQHKRRKYMLFAMSITIIALLSILIITFIIIFGFPSLSKNSSSSNISSNSTSSSSDSVSSSTYSSITSSSNSSSNIDNIVAVPNLVGQALSSIQNNPVYNQFFKFNASYSYSDSVKKGVIISQSISPNTEVSNGTTIPITVSKGTRYPIIPDYYGLPVDEYTDSLNELGIKYTVKKEPAYGYPSGYVFKTSIEYGQKIDLESNTVLIVYITDSQ